MHMTDTIYALSSGAVPSGVAVIRISGPAAGGAVLALTRPLPEPRQAALRMIRRPGGEVIDQGLVLWFPGPRSETGEDMAELQLHGGRAVVQAVFDALAEQGLRLATPGEFARRAFQHGKLDLTAVEGLADLIAAETEVQRRQALGQAAGALGTLAESWREALLGLRAEIEARLDFSDEGDVAEKLPADFRQRIDGLRSAMAEALAGAASGERLRQGFRVAILGRPNAGKSSLLNALARRDVAIVTEEPGTTRDVLEVSLDLGGYPVLLFDTAGIREADSRAEAEGVRRAKRTAESADLILWLEDSTTKGEDAPRLPDRPIWRISTKVDLMGSVRQSGLGVSVVSGAGLRQLAEKLREEAADSLGPGNALVTRQRQKEAIQAALDALDVAPALADEVTADLLRRASEAIGRLTGRVGVEDMLDRLFAEFCIGK
jgi:tRNA modification GTPase